MTDTKPQAGTIALTYDHDGTLLFGNVYVARHKDGALKGAQAKAAKWYARRDKECRIVVMHAHTLAVLHDARYRFVQHPTIRWRHALEEIA